MYGLCALNCVDEINDRTKKIVYRHSIHNAEPNEKNCLRGCNEHTKLPTLIVCVLKSESTQYVAISSDGIDLIKWQIH